MVAEPDLTLEHKEFQKSCISGMPITLIDGKNGSDDMTNAELDSELVTFNLLIYPEHDII